MGEVGRLQPLVDYGYRKCHSALGNACYYINHKKVYRLMKESRYCAEHVSKRRAR